MMVKSLSDPVEISFDTGIDAQMSNSGSQHFLEGERRIFDKKYIQLVQTTNESNIDVVINSSHKVIVNDEERIDNPEMNMARRKVWLTYDFNLQPNDTLEMEKLTTVYTSRDKEYDQSEYNLQQLTDNSLNDLRTSSEKDMIYSFNHIKKPGIIVFGMHIN